MKILNSIYSYLTAWGMSPGWADMLDDVIAFVLILIIALLADVICRHFILRAVAHLVKKTKATWDDVLFDHKVMVRFSRMVIPVVFYLLLPLIALIYLVGSNTYTMAYSATLSIIVAMVVGVIHKIIPHIGFSKDGEEENDG